ncbi:MAG: hypothetical protein K9G46_01255 [Flavobacteriales bacterium]|nr:hypothetical protein [Flavobacteriales bacterium]
MENSNETPRYKTVTHFLCDLIRNPDFASFPRSFAYPSGLPKKSILFLGLQPPMSEDKEKRYRFEMYKQGTKGDKNQYIKQFAEIAEYCNTPWAHLNLLFFRKTKNNGIDEILKKEAGVQFIWEQLKVTDQLIRQIEPEIIVSLNKTDASTFMGFNKTDNGNAWLDYEFVFDNEIDTYRWEGTPVFFTKLFKGQRTLDNGSFEKLKWQIRNALILDLEKKKKEVVELKNKVVKSSKYELAAEIRNQERELEDRLEKLRFSNTQ